MTNIFSIYFVILYHRLYILLHTVLSFTVTCTVTVLYFVLLPTSHCYFGQTMNLTVFGLLVAYGVDSVAVMAASVFMTIRILWPKWSGPKVVILSGVYCNNFFSNISSFGGNVVIKHERNAITSGIKRQYLVMLAFLTLLLSVTR